MRCQRDLVLLNAKNARSSSAKTRVVFGTSVTWYRTRPGDGLVTAQVSTSIVSTSSCMVEEMTGLMPLEIEILRRYLSVIRHGFIEG